MLGHQVWWLLGLKVIIKLQVFSYIQASATHRETPSKNTLPQLVMSNSPPKDCEKFRDESPQLHPLRLTPRWRAVMDQRGEACTVTSPHAAPFTESAHHQSLLCLLRALCQKVVNHWRLILKESIFHISEWTTSIPSHYQLQRNSGDTGKWR